MAQKDLFDLESCMETDNTFECGTMDFGELDYSTTTGRCVLHEGFQIEIQEQHSSMRQMVNIIIAAQKFKTSRRVQSTMFSDHELFNIIMENIVEERVAKELHSQEPETYSKQDKVIQCTVCDILQKNLVQSTGAPILQAVTLKGGNLSKRVWFNLASYTSPSHSTMKGQPVCLGIAKSNLYLTCTNVSGKPILSIEEIKNKDMLKTININNEMERFLFCRKGTGDSINTFESVKYPGWFISTTQTDYEPVDMCMESDASRVRVFKLLDKTVISDN